jgi:cytochrome d ubiquinol oxidase subunit II
VMALANTVLAFLWVGITAYVLFGGADFGGGFWDLLAGGAQRGARYRQSIEESIGPVWEANHVWLIFALVVLWTAFPPVFASIFSTLYIPLTAAAFGVILRGSAFAFRKSVSELSLQRLFGAMFAISSVATPFFLGTVAGAVASGRVPAGNARGDVITSWVNPTSLLGGVLAVAVCAYLASVYLTADARRRRTHDIAEYFRRRALAAGIVTGAIALVGIDVLHQDAPVLYAGLTGRAAGLIGASAVFGAGSLVLMWWRRYLTVRLTAASAVVAVLWGWAVGQYPDLLVGAGTVDQAAAPHPVLAALVVALSVGSALVIPALVLLYALFQATPGRAGDAPSSG